jgi:hypothetical protein
VLSVRGARGFAGVLAIAGLELAGVRAHSWQKAGVAPARDIPYADARSMIDALREDLLPAELRVPPPAREAAWPAWVRRRDDAIRARVLRGDEDSIVNFLLYGTTFTREPRPSVAQVATLATDQEDLPRVIASRIDDFARALVDPTRNERLRFSRDVVERRGIDPGTVEGARALRQYLTDSVRRARAEVADASGAIRAGIQRDGGDATLLELRTAFRERGLSTDTSMLVNFAVEQTLDEMKSRKLLTAAGVQRVGLVGPGLDFTDKDEGYDFYPVQTIQPFALIDSLVGLGLARADRVQVTTLDVNPRINRHLEEARARAGQGSPYRLVIPRDMEKPWRAPLVAYWERVGRFVAGAAETGTAPAHAGKVRARTLAVRPEIVRSIVPAEANIVLQRLEPLAPDERFDLIVATDVLVYYDVFEQSLALANAAAMLRKGGLLVSNTALPTLPGIPMDEAGRIEVRHMPLPGIGELKDRMVWYRRQ